MCVAENGTIKNFKPLDLGVPQFLPLNWQRYAQLRDAKKRWQIRAYLVSSCFKPNKIFSAHICYCRSVIW
jgi:hypothetical protein